MVDPDKVTEILLVDGWHKIDTSREPVFEVVTHGIGPESPHPRLQSIGTERGFLVCEAGETGALLTGPLSTILAYRYKVTA